jgi:hypothetical protein
VYILVDMVDINAVISGVEEDVYNRALKGGFGGQETHAPADIASGWFCLACQVDRPCVRHFFYVLQL